MSYENAPETVDREELSFEPEVGHVYYCHDCESHVDVGDVSDHAPGNPGHRGAVRLTRVDVVG